MVFLLALLTGAPGFQTVFGSEPYTGLSKRALPEDLPLALSVGTDGSLFVVGTNNYRDGEPKPNTIGSYCAKLDKSGKLLWWSHVGVIDAVEVATATKDGGLLLAGKTHVGEATRGINLFKFDASGAREWTRRDPSEQICDGDRCAMNQYDVEPIAMTRIENDEVRVLARVRLQRESIQGNVRRIEPVETDALIRYGAQGALLGATFLDGLCALNSRLSVPTRITNDGSVWSLITGKTTNAAELLHYDKNGKRLAGARFTAKGGNDLVVTTSSARDGGVIIAGWYRRGTVETINSSIYRYDSAGALKWEWHGLLEGHLGPAAQCADESFILNVGQFEGAQASLSRVKDDGSFDWSKPVGNKRTSPHYIAQHEDGIILFGYTKEFDAWYSDLYLLRTDATGDLGKKPKRMSPAR